MSVPLLLGTDYTDVHVPNICGPKGCIQVLDVWPFWAPPLWFVIQPKGPLDQHGPSKELPRKSTHSPAFPKREERITANPRGES